WMGSVQEDAFYAPHDLCVEIQDFLADHEFLFSTQSLSDIAILYSVESDFYGGTRPEEIANNPENIRQGSRLPFWDVCDVLATARQPFDVRFLPDGTLRSDDPNRLDFNQYRTVILPACHFLTELQSNALTKFCGNGGQIVSLGTPGKNLPSEIQRSLTDHSHMTIVDSFSIADVPEQLQLCWSDNLDLAINIVSVERGSAIHIIRYDYNDENDAVLVLPSLELAVRLHATISRASFFSPGDVLIGTMRRDGDWYRIRLEHVPLYSIVLLEE
ncbi:MAG: hypothetical protein ACR2OU_14570, partial [Thermomicrobiales bacterium]